MRNRVSHIPISSIFFPVSTLAAPAQKGRGELQVIPRESEGRHTMGEQIAATWSLNRLWKSLNGYAVARSRFEQDVVQEFGLGYCACAPTHPGYPCLIMPTLRQRKSEAWSPFVRLLARKPQNTMASSCCKMQSLLCSQRSMDSYIT